MPRRTDHATRQTKVDSTSEGQVFQAVRETVCLSVVQEREDMTEVLQCACGRRYGMPLAGTSKRCECGTPFAYGRVVEQQTVSQQEVGDVPKSLLDGMRVKENSQYQELMGTVTTSRHGIVSYCPHCNAPIYGPQLIGADEEPLVRFSCQCRRRFGDESK